MKKMTNEVMMTVNGGKHYYVTHCTACETVYSDDAIGRALMKSHNKKKGGSYYKKDVCTAMGCHTASCKDIY